MSRINAGSTLVNQYAPPFVVSDSTTTNWHLRWSDTLLAFEAYDPSENVTEGGFSSIETTLFPNVTQQVFVVPWEAATKQSVFITIEGVKQQQDAYTITTNTGSGSTTVTLADTVAVETVEILGLQTDDNGAAVEVYIETAIAAQTLFPAAGGIGWYPPSEASLIITLDGIKQNQGAYSIVPNSTFTDAQIQLVAAPGAGVVVEALGINITGEVIASPVEMANAVIDAAPTTMGLFKTKTVSGETQIFTFKGLTSGAGITLADGAGSNSVQITSDQPTFVTGPGTSIIDDIGTTDPLKIRGLGAGDRIGLSVTGSSPNEQVIIAYAFGYKSITDADSPYTVLALERLIHVLPGAATTVLLPAASTFTAGDTITIKDANGLAGTNNITVTPDGSDDIDGNNTDVVLNTARAYLTLYSDNADWHIIGQG